MSSPTESQVRSQQRAEALFQRGNDALVSGNLDYAAEMYRQAIDLFPGTLVYRQALRSAQRRGFQNDPSKVGRLVGARLQPLRIRIRTAKTRKHWSEALALCEEVFALNPWDVAAAIDASEVSGRLEYSEIALWVLESVAGQAGEDVAFFRALARAHELNKNWSKAIFCWEQVRKLKPDDDEANNKVRSLAASETIDRAGLQQGMARRFSAEAAAHNEAAEDSPADPEQTPEQRFRSRIEADPQDIGAYLGWAEHQQRAGQLDQAEKILTAALKVAPRDTRLIRNHGQIQTERIQRAVRHWTGKLEQEPDDPEARAKLEQARQLLREHQVRELRREIKADPDNAQLHFQLGQLHQQAGAYQEAIPEYQQARHDPELKVDALVQAGTCFEQTRNPKLAERCYADALKACPPDDETHRNELNYRLGCLAEARGDLNQAEEFFNEVAANNFAYRDVAQRIQRLQNSADS